MSHDGKIQGNSFKMNPCSLLHTMYSLYSIVTIAAAGIYWGFFALSLILHIAQYFWPGIGPVLLIYTGGMKKDGEFERKIGGKEGRCREGWKEERNGERRRMEEGKKEERG